MSNTVLESDSIPESSPTTVAGTFHRLLRCPAEMVSEAENGGLSMAGRLFAGAALFLAAYGLALGLFGGGWQILVAMVKVPLIVFATLVLCMPSFYVFSALAGSSFSLRGTIVLLFGFAGTLSLLLLGFMPVTWLFSVGTRSTGFIVFMQVVLWAIAIAFARKFVTLAFASLALRRVVFLWSLLFMIVSFQMTTHLRPVLWEPGDHIFEEPGVSFLEHLSGLKD